MSFLSSGETVIEMTTMLGKYEDENAGSEEQLSTSTAQDGSIGNVFGEDASSRNSPYDFKLKNSFFMQVKLSQMNVY